MLGWSKLPPLPFTYSQTNPVEPRGKYFRRNEWDRVRCNRERKGAGESGANAIEKFAHKATPTIAFHRSIVEGSLSLSPMENERIACALLSQTQSWREGGMDDRGHWENIITCMRRTWIPCLDSKHILYVYTYSWETMLEHALLIKASFIILSVLVRVSSNLYTNLH